ncbi:MAG: RluA family pseudouridine synthase [Deltaproteobacteria bacterium]|nr:RluA family pseudouridine synthase [Deltaproteobacteria bacterium]
MARELQENHQNRFFDVARDRERTDLFLIDERNAGKRIDIFLTGNVKDLTRSRVQGLIKEGLVRINSDLTKTSYKLKSGDRLTLTIPPVIPYVLEPEKVKFSLVYEDSSLIVINKPPGLVIHPAPGHSNGTLVHGLLYYCKDLSGIGGIMRPGIVHRLDKDTSGLMVIAKNDKAHTSLSDQFKSRSIKKRYIALVHGLVSGEKGKIDLPVARHPIKRKEMSVRSSGGKKAITLWNKIEVLAERFSLLSVTLKTGRTHQIRIHLAHWGYPIVGDTVYGYKEGWWKKNFPVAMNLVSNINRQMLHSETLGFIHPDSGEYCEFSVPLPDDMVKIIESLKTLYLSHKMVEKS